MTTPGSSDAGTTASTRPRTAEHPRFNLLNYGFRPFFLLAGLHAGVAIPVWMAFLYGFGASSTSIPTFAWHAHEMIFGFVMAAMAGFLLTAVPSWTGQRGFAGRPLLVLVLVWLAGRIAVSWPIGLPPSVIAAVDLAFPAALAVAIVPSLLRSGNRRNFIFVGFLGLLFAANLNFHLAGATSLESLHLAVNTVAVMVTIVGGRIVPAFTSARLKQLGHDVRIPKSPILDGSAIAATIIVLVVDIGAPGSGAAGAAAVAAAVLLVLRLSRWHGHRTVSEPLLWILHVAYAWLPLGFALKAAWLFGGLVPSSAWLHALTAGGFASMILAVMTRATLGHTGRELVASPGTVVAYALLSVAALVRVFGPTFAPAHWSAWIAGAGVLWTVAFALFLTVYAPMLCRARQDGKPG